MSVLEKIISKSIFNYLKNLLKEAITLTYCIDYLHKNNNYINITQTSNLGRFKVARINRMFIYKTLKKYNIEYTTSLK